MRALMTDTLRRAGVTVDEVGDGRALLDRMRHRTFDLVVSDLRMPLVGGLDAIRALRAEGVSTPFVLTTAFADEVTFAEARRCGTCIVLDKPFAMDDLRATVLRILSSRTAP
jgi:DNA-binding NtrC family response regulator